MFSRLLFLFVAVPLVELVLLIQLGRLVGLVPTLLLVFVTGVAGAALARREGLRTLSAIQAELAQGRIPGRTLLDGASILVGGAFLLTPGLLTDVFGFSLLIPVTRRWFGDRLRAWFQRQLASGRIQYGFMASGPGGSEIWSSPGGRTTRPGMDDDGPEGEGPDGRAHMGLDPRNEILER